MLKATGTVRFAIIGFTVVSVLVLSGLTWATIASLRLERATQETQAALREVDRLQIARLRMDNARLLTDDYIWPIRYREANRPYRQYGAYYYEEDDGSGDADLKESPLRTEGTESWIALYFQVTEEPCWTSPQLLPLTKHPHEHLTDGSSALGELQTQQSVPLTCVIVDSSDPSAVEHKSLLDLLALGYNPEDFAERIRAVADAPSDTPGEDLGTGIDTDSGKRHARAASIQRAFLPPPQECEPSRQVHRVTGRHLIFPADTVEEEYFRVVVNWMTPIWLPLPGEENPRLVLVRRVDIGNDRVFQGFVVDLPELTQVLASVVKDLFEDIRLEPTHVEFDSDQPSTALGSLPLRLIASEPQLAIAPVHTRFVRTTVGFAWFTALIALAAIGMGVKRLVSLSERRREFTYAVTHELRTPLTTFQLYTDMLAAKLVPEEKRAYYLETLNQESKRLSDLVTEVLEFSRIESNAVQAHMRSHSIRDLLDTVRQRYESRCRAASMAFTIEANGAGDRLLYTDPDIALQALGTLIDNACKYASVATRAPEAEDAEPGGTAPAVRVRVIDTGNKLAIEVRDNGPGIASKDRRDLFKPFQRGSQNKVPGGVGLGLALAKRWARLIRGSLELVDRPEGRGACFRLTLPANAT